MSRFLLITGDPEFEAKTRGAIPGGGDLRTLRPVPAAGSGEMLARLGGAAPDVVLLGPGLTVTEALKLAADFNQHYPQVALTLVSRPHAKIAVEAMRAGICDLLTADSVVEDISAMLERAARVSAVRRTTGSADGTASDVGRIIGVMSPKGGVGKTTVATNLAVGLARNAPRGVVIVDLDLQFGDVASGLSLEPEHTLFEAVNGAASQDAMVLKAFLTTHRSGLYALCAPTSPADADRISTDQTTRLLKQLAEQFSYVVVDTAPGLGEHGLSILEQASDVVWVCGMDIPSIRGLRSALAILTELNLMPAEQHMVLNFAHRRSGLTVHDVEATMGVPLDVILPFSRTLPFSTNKGVPLLQGLSRDPSARALSKLVERFEPRSAKPRQDVPELEVAQ